MNKVGTNIILSAQDLVGHLNCRHRTFQDLALANGQIAKPKIWNDPQLQLLRERGAIHEKNYIDQLKVPASEIVKIEGVDVTEESTKQTIEAMRSGKQIIVQGAFYHNGWCGRIDVLQRINTPSALGDWSYEVIDTKLSRETKGGTVLQLCLYSELLFHVQGAHPEFMYVVIPWSGFEPIKFRVQDYAAYYRRVKNSLVSMITSSEKQATYPDPKEACDTCRWILDCEKKRRDDDHLCLVANIRKTQINELKRRDTQTTSQLASIPIPLTWKPERGSADSYVRIREQARLQTEGYRAQKMIHEILPLEAGFGFYCLPEPSEGDVFLDFEGDPFVGEHGLEYLLGYQYKSSEGQIKYVASWALNRTDEKKAFELFVDFVMARWAQHPNMHIYHYAAYEPVALKRLMGRYATREEEIDKMLRGKLFVDLSTIARQGIRASVESYSLKKLEPLYKFKRNTDLMTANSSLFCIQAYLELNDASAITKEIKDVVEGYNRDDCASAYALRNWLEELRADLVSQGKAIQRPSPSDGEASENITDWLLKIQSLVSRLTKDVPILEAERTNEQHGRWLLANIIDWHRREQKALWWEYFRLASLSAEDLLDEKAGLSGLSFVKEAGGTSRAPIHRYKFPAQESDLRGGEPLHAIGGNKFGAVESITFQDNTIDVKKRGDSKDIHPSAIFSHKVVDAKELADSLIRLGEYVADKGISGAGSYQAARDLLLRERPRIGSEPIINSGESPEIAATRIAPKLSGGIFPIQGPPGAGKTYTGSQMICALVQKGKKVGITANSHKVIRHLLDAVIKTADRMKIEVQCVQKPSEMEPNIHRLSFAKSPNDLFTALQGSCQVAGGTAWVWSRPDAFETVDVLFVDEAAQMSLANVLAVSQAGKTVVLLGDPQQLDQPMQGSHPEGTDVSALNHILGNQQTISPDQGLFLGETWRLHPQICAFTSELFYDGKLESKAGLQVQVVKSSGKISGSGLRYFPVIHSGNSNASPEEALIVKDIVSDILKSKSTWVDHDGTERLVTLEDILIITPYNAQVFEIQQCIPGARAGTVDKFQGQQAPISIYSMATSSYEDAPRGMEFLYSLNRLNVATSRAKCISILVSSPQVFETECRTPRQMKLANAFCRYLEMSQT